MRAMAAAAAGMAVSVFASTAGAITIQLDYSYDTSNFFNSGSTNSDAARAALETAAGQLSSYLADTFSAIETPDTYFSSASNGSVSWSWEQQFTHPGNGSIVSLFNQTIAADTYVIYAGARSLTGNTAGQGGPGGLGWSSTPSGTFSPGEIAEITVINDAFSDAVEHRGETSGFANWGGAITFDNDGSTNWWYDHTTPVGDGATDFYSVALHELVHALGFGASSEWNDLVHGGLFTGLASKAEHGWTVPVSPTGDHWLEGTLSTTFIGGDSQEVAMDPTITDGDRKFLTALDAAGLTDIGWTVVPEPASVTALLVGGLVAVARRRRAA